MEENIHNDKLDEFVNRSFESYSENPPDSLWDAIEAGLETPVIHPVKVAGFPIWKYAAGLLILLLSAALITQHLFYKEKLNQITQANIRQNKLTPTTPKAPESVLKTGGNENLL
ncbi:MAG TPA: hypothetical protein VK590_06795, partial [Saprospiraceae bacterium]|nr:hypothetical protein [Saprospiraceae bacterium]